MTPLKTPSEIAKETVAKIRKHVEVRCEEWDESMFVEKEISKLIQSERSINSKGEALIMAALAYHHAKDREESKILKLKFIEACANYENA